MTAETIFHDPRAVALYECCRCIDERVLNVASQMLWDLAKDVAKAENLERFTIVEAGSGTGRLFIPVVQRRQASPANDL